MGPLKVRAANVLLVTNNNGSLTAQETLRRNQFQTWGHTVSTIWDGASQATYDATFAVNDVIYVSEEASASDLGYKLRMALIGVVNEDRSLPAELGLSSSDASTTSTAWVSVTDNTHEITESFSTGFLIFATGFVPSVYLGGITASGGQTLATIGGEPALLVIETGGTLANTYNGNSTAAGRRVQLPVGGDDFDFARLNANGLTIVQQSLQWAGSPSPPAAHWKLDESSGTSAADATGHGHTGTVTGTAAWVAAVRKNGFSFNGSTRIQASGLMNSPKNISLAAWANLTTADTNGAEVISLGDHVILRLDQAGSAKAIIYNGSTQVPVTINQTFAGSGWHHFAAVFDDDNNSFKLYVDGVQAASTSTTSSISYSGLGSNTVIGRHGNGLTTYDFAGMIDDVYVFGYAISAKQVAELYGLVGHWKLNETSGTTVADSSGTQSNGTVAGAPHWSTDCGGNGVFDFDGNSNHISIPSSSYLQPTESLTIAAWIKGDAWGSGGDVDVILRKGEGAPNDYQLAIAAGRATLSLYRDSTHSISAAGNTELEPGLWYHVAAVWDGATVKVYVNGQLDNTPAAFTGTIATDTRSVYLGGQTGSNYFDGMMRGVQLYNRALSATEIVAMCGMVGHWKLDETSGTTAVDSSGMGHNGTIVGTAAWTDGHVDGDGDGHAEGAISFGGSGYVEIPYDQTLDSRTYTVSAWVYCTEISDEFESGILGTRSNGVEYGFDVKVDPGVIHGDIPAVGTSWLDTSVDIRSEDTGSNGQGGELALSHWYMVTYVVDGASNTADLYLDGDLKRTIPLAGTPRFIRPGQTVMIGNSASSYGEFFHGKIDDVRLYNRALCPEEIEELYGQGVFPGVRIIKWVEIQ
jgi:hypothetical protein